MYRVLKALLLTTHSLAQDKEQQSKADTGRHPLPTKLLSDVIAPDVVGTMLGLCINEEHATC